MVASTSARLLAALIAMIAAYSMGLQLYLNTLDLGSVTAGALQMSRYFTILTNIAVIAMMAGIAMGWRAPRMLILSMVTAIIGVGIIYHVALSHLLNQQGWEIVSDQGVHTVVPVLSALWWVLYATSAKGALRRMHCVTLWPLLYAGYAIARGNVDGLYPYPFMDLNVISPGILSRNFVILLVIFWIIGAIMHGTAQLRRGR